MLNTKEMQLQSLETIGEYLQGVRQAVEESGNDDLIRISCISAGKRLFQTMTAAENEEPPAWYLQNMLRNYSDLMTEEKKAETVEALEERGYNEAPTRDQYKTAMREMIDSVESAAYDLLKTCGIYSRIPADEYDTVSIIADFSDEVKNSTREILDAIVKAGELGERFLFNLSWKQFAPEGQEETEDQEGGEA